MLRAPRTFSPHVDGGYFEPDDRLFDVPVAGCLYRFEHERPLVERALERRILRSVTRRHQSSHVTARGETP